MYHRLPIIVSCVFLLACSQIDAPREVAEGGSSVTASNRTSSDSKAVSTSPSTRQEYRKTYNLFKVHHRNVFELVNENKFALRNEGQKSVQAAEDMLSMLSEQDQSELEDIVNNYQKAWDGFDQKSPSVGERNRLKSAGNKIRKDFNPDSVQLKSPEVAKSSQTEEQSDNAREQRIERDTSSRNIAVKNPSRYRKLFKRWQHAHQQFQQGIENDDPLIKSSYDELKIIVQNMIAQVESGKDKLKNYYLSQYEMIFAQREQFVGTPAKSDHLTYLKRQFEREFALPSK